MWCQLRSPKSPLSSSAPGSQPSRQLAPHQLLQLSRAHSAPPPCFPSLVPLELGLDVERTLSSGHKLKGKPWVPQGLLFHPPFLSQESSVFFFTLGPDPEALRIAFSPASQYSPGFSKEALLEVKERSRTREECFQPSALSAVAHNPTDSQSLHLLSNTLPSAPSCPVPCCTPCLMPLSLLSPRPACPNCQGPSSHICVLSFLGAQPPRILVLHSLGNATFCGFNPVRTYGDP